MNHATQLNADAPATAVAAPPTPVKGLLILLAVVVVMGAYMMLNHLLGITEVWVSILFVLYWGGIDHANMETLPADIVGAVVGLLTAYALQQLPLSLGSSAGMIVFLGLILALVYCQVMGWLTLAVNMATMLFLTVGTIPLIQVGLNIAGALISLAFGIVFFAGLIWAGQMLQKKSVPK